MNGRIWKVLPALTEKVWADHAEAGMLGGHHDPDHALRVAQMAFDLEGPSETGVLAGAAGLVHNADRILQHKLGLGARGQVSKQDVQALIMLELSSDNYFLPEDKFDESHKRRKATVVDAVMRHDSKNQEDDSAVQIALMDADRLVNAEPELVIRSAQYFKDLPAIDPVHFDADPTANYRNPKSVLRDIMETLEWLTPGTPFYVRLPKARELAAIRRKFFDNLLAEILKCRHETGFLPYPPELLELRQRFLKQE